MKDKTINKRIKIPINLPVFFVGFLLTIGVCIYFAWIGVKNYQTSALHISEVYAARIESLLNGLFHKTDVLESIIITSKGDVSEEVFQDLAKSLFNGLGIRAIQYLPSGTVKYCYPKEGNEAAIGGNVFENPKRKKDALLAVETRDIALSGPYELTQGGLGLVARNPIFLTNSEGEEEFWGFSAIILDLPEALEPILFEELEREGYQFQLSCIVETEKMSIIETIHFSGEEAVNAEIHVPNHIWTLSLEPKHGWINWEKNITGVIIGTLLSLFCAVGIYQLYERQAVYHHFAVTDELTGILNRRGLSERIEEWCQQADRLFIFLYMDLNWFKQINDTYGHFIGDELLKEAARRLKKSVVENISVCGRIGGDEFIVLIQGKKQDIEKIQEMIGKNMKPSFKCQGCKLKISISIGYAFFPEEGKTYDELIKIADERMYQNKKEIKDSTIFSEE